MPRPVTSEAELWDRALNLLSRRAHARAELQAKLTRYRPDPAHLAAVMARLEQAGWLNDGAFGVDRAGSLARQGKLGPSRIRRRLSQHGLQKADVDAAVSATEVDWAARCRQVARDRAARGLDLTDPRDRARLVRFLLGRGFSYDTIGPAMRALGADAASVNDEGADDDAEG